MVDKYKGVVEIEILGEKRGFKFGMAQQEMVLDLEKCSVEEYLQRMEQRDTSTIINLYYSGAVCYARLFKKEEPTRDEVANWLDNFPSDGFDTVNKVLEGYEDPNLKAPQKEG